MQLRTQIFGISVAIVLVVVIWRLVHKKRLREQYSLLWLMAGLALLTLSISRGTLSGVARFLHVGYPPTLLLSVGVLFAVVIQLSHSVAISKMSRRDRDLAQEVAMLRLLLEEKRTETRIERALERKWSDGADAGATSRLDRPGHDRPQAQVESISESAEVVV